MQPTASHMSYHPGYLSTAQDAIDRIARPVGIGFALQPMHVGIEPRKALGEVLRELKVIDNRARLGGESLARHDQRNSRRIWHQHHGRDTPFQLLDRHRFLLDRKSVVE